MDQVINFIKVYWRELLNLATIILAIVLWCVRKKPIKVVDTLKEVIVRVLPALINKAENEVQVSAYPRSGKDKMEFVLRELASILRELNYGDDVIAQYLPFAREQVELILSTPQKKVRKL